MSQNALKIVNLTDLDRNKYSVRITGDLTSVVIKLKHPRLAEFLCLGLNVSSDPFILFD